MDAQRVQRKLKAMERYIERYYWEVVLSGSPRSPRELAMTGDPLKQLLWLVIGARIMKLLKISEMEDVCQSIFLHWRAIAMEYVAHTRRNIMINKT